MKPGARAPARACVYRRILSGQRCGGSKLRGAQEAQSLLVEAYAAPGDLVEQVTGDFHWSIRAVPGSAAERQGGKTGHRTLRHLLVSTMKRGSNFTFSRPGRSIYPAGFATIRVPPTW